jgi:RNA polymerase sigma factor (sigma-70 family)
MATASTGTIRADLCATWVPAGSEPLDDEVLLDRFLEGDEAASGAAFQELVRRHGPMVLGVCRHILDGYHDAEDAFQATFLVLARNAAAIRDRRVLARWLYEVAYRTAVRARSRSVRRRTQEKEAVEMSSQGHASESDPAWRELRPVLHEEVNRLPERYRSAVVLCYLEGRTNEEAAAILRWPVGTVKGRLSRAREMLRSRLTRRGLALSAVFLLSRLSQNAVFAEVVPRRLLDLTAETALAVTRGSKTAAASVAPGVLELAEDVPVMFPAAMTGRVVALASLALLFGAFALFAWSTPFYQRNATVFVPNGPAASVRPTAPVMTPVHLSGASGFKSCGGSPSE